METLTGHQAMGWEFFGTMMLMLFGNGVCAAVNLRTSTARNTNWLTIAFGWGLAVFIGASIADKTGGHLNPAVTWMRTAMTSRETPRRKEFSSPSPLIPTTFGMH